MENSIVTNKCNKDVTTYNTTGPSYTKLVVEELNNKNDIIGKINNTILLCDNEDTIMKDIGEIPSRHEIMKTSTFGNTIKDHYFTSEAYFEHTFVFIFEIQSLAKNKIRKSTSVLYLIQTPTPYDELVKKIDFSSIQNLIDNYVQ